MAKPGPKPGSRIYQGSSPSVIANWRASIDVAKIRERIQHSALGIDHVVGGQVKPPMDANALRAAELLLSRAIPTVSAATIEVSGPNGGPMQVEASVQVYMPTNNRERK
jgi:hypothetical protein